MIPKSYICNSVAYTHLDVYKRQVGDNAELEDIAKMPIDIGLFNLRISRRARKVQQPDGES